MRKVGEKNEREREREHYTSLRDKILMELVNEKISGFVFLIRTLTEP